jgi:glc operon protein GlcG
MDDELSVEVRMVSAAGSKIALAAAEQAALAKNLAVSIAVVDSVGNLVAFQRTGNACSTSIEAALRKARTSANLSAPTKLFEDLVHSGMTSLLTFEFISPSQGGVPLMVDGVTIGGIGCSGSTGEEDEMIASAGAIALEEAISSR